MKLSVSPRATLRALGTSALTGALLLAATAAPVLAQTATPTPQPTKQAPIFRFATTYKFKINNGTYPGALTKLAGMEREVLELNRKYDLGISLVTVAGDWVYDGNSLAAFANGKRYAEESQLNWQPSAGTYDRSNYQDANGNWVESLDKFNTYSGFNANRAYTIGNIRFIHTAAMQNSTAEETFLQNELSAADSNAAITHVFVVAENPLTWTNNWAKYWPNNNFAKNKKPFIWMWGMEDIWRPTPGTGATTTSGPRDTLDHVHLSMPETLGGISATGINAGEAHGANGNRFCYAIVSVFPDRIVWEERKIDDGTRLTHRAAFDYNRAGGTVAISTAIPWEQQLDLTTVVPDAPTNISATTDTFPGFHHVMINWSDAPHTEQSYAIDRRVPGGTWAQIGTAAINITQFIDTSAQGGTTYEYRVRAVNAAGSTPSASTAVTTGNSVEVPGTIKIAFGPSTAPLTTGFSRDSGGVYGLRASGQTYGWNTGVSLTTRRVSAFHSQLYGCNLTVADIGTWEIEVPNGDYDVKVVTGDATEGSSQEHQVEGTVYWTNTNLNRGVFATKTARVTVNDGRLTLKVGKSGRDPRTVFLMIAPVAPPVAAPANLSAMAGTNQIALAWDAVSGATGYNVYRGTASGVYGTTPINSSPLTTTTFTDTAVTAGTTYFYIVKAVNSAGESAASNQASATLPAATLSLAQYQFQSVLTSSDTDANSTASNFAEGSGLSGMGTFTSYNSSTSRALNISNVSQFVYSESAAVSGNKFQQFSVSAVSGRTLTLDKLTFDSFRVGAGFEYVAVYLSTNGTNFTKVGSSFQTGAANPKTVLLNTSTYANIPQVWVRFYWWRVNTGGDVGNRNALDNITLSGTTNASGALSGQTTTSGNSF